MDIKNSGKYIFLGGTRSGKSLLAENTIATGHSEICYVATAPRAWVMSDADFAARVAGHQARRGANWRTVELDVPGDLYDLIENAEIPTLVDSVGGWVAHDIDFIPDFLRLERAIRRCNVPLSFVAEEAGLSVHPQSAAVRRYVDLLGQANQTIANCVDRVFFVAAGRVIELFSLIFAGEVS
ncbi:MAG: bifunctional adenosylcobinamide kinase/adenosylcobinamide-phosphate guanylyltransferase [Actinomycetota bacterium]|nr:bifunctional adenosylcobinamide kinase/adenosylcobinamide-phosphate guanylyltransferase [Actinomycetota bacterium]